jgi:hypothetical protein
MFVVPRARTGNCYRTSNATGFHKPLLLHPSAYNYNNVLLRVKLFFSIEHLKSDFSQRN